MIKITPEDSGMLRVTKEIQVGYISFKEGFELPWTAQDGIFIKSFKTQPEALDWLLERGQ